MKLITAPAAEPVTLAEAKAHLRVTHADDDALIAALIPVARQEAEQLLGRSLITQTWELARDAFAAAIELPRGPVASIGSVKFDDPDGVEQTVDPATYRLDNYGLRHWLLTAGGYDWPDTFPQPNAVRVRFTAGYGAAAADVPAPIRHWLLIRIATLFEHREAVAAGVPVAAVPLVDRLIDSYRVILP